MDNFFCETEFWVSGFENPTLVKYKMKIIKIQYAIAFHESIDRSKQNGLNGKQKT